MELYLQYLLYFAAFCFVYVVYSFTSEFLKAYKLDQIFNTSLSNSSFSKEVTKDRLTSLFEIKIAKDLSAFVKKLMSQATLERKELFKQAGIYNRLIIRNFLFIKVSTASFCLFIVYLVSSEVINLEFYYAVGISVVGSIAGFILPDKYFEAKAAERLKDASKYFPDLIQYLIIALSSGLGVEAALRRISPQIEKQSVVIAQEVNILLAELTILADKKQAYSNLAKRLQSESYKSLTVILQQAATQGVSVIPALRSISELHVNEVATALEAKVGRISVLMTVPLIVFIFPILIGVIVIPSIVLNDGF